MHITLYFYVTFYIFFILYIFVSYEQLEHPFFPPTQHYKENFNDTKLLRHFSAAWAAETSPFTSLPLFLFFGTSLSLFAIVRLD